MSREVTDGLLMFGCVVAGYLLARGLSFALGNWTPSMFGPREAEIVGHIAGLLFSLGSYLFFYNRKSPTIEMEKEPTE